MILSRVAFETRVTFAGRGMPIPKKFKRSFEHSGQRSPRQDRARRHRRYSWKILRRRFGGEAIRKVPILAAMVSNRGTVQLLD